MDARNNSKMGKGKAPRHTSDQIQQLEAFFEKNPNPSETQKKHLSRKLGLDKDQVKFWFQNKKVQIKAHNDRVENTVLRSENERLKNENQAFSGVLKNVLCPECDDRPPVGDQERNFTVEKLRVENALLRGEYERIANEITRRTGKPIAHLLSLPPESLDHLLSLPSETSIGQQSRSSSIAFDRTDMD